jgi:hypothetical protein
MDEHDPLPPPKPFEKVLEVELNLLELRRRAIHQRALGDRLSGPRGAELPFPPKPGAVLGLASRTMRSVLETSGDETIASPEGGHGPSLSSGKIDGDFAKALDELKAETPRSKEEDKRVLSPPISEMIPAETRAVLATFRWLFATDDPWAGPRSEATRNSESPLRPEVTATPSARWTESGSPGEGLARPKSGNAKDETSDGEPDPLAKQRNRALEAHLVGLAISGGGIRSAAFAVGILQGLASLGLLRRFDYLSTVSGGGYTGGWLAAWLRREGDIENVERQLGLSRVEQAKAQRPWIPPRQTVDEEPEPLFHLRSYSSYLNPRSGLMTADTWSVIAIYLRNVAINLAMLLPAAFAAVMAIWLIVAIYGAMAETANSGNQIGQIGAVLLTGLFGGSLWRALSINTRTVKAIRQRDKDHVPGTLRTSDAREPTLNSRSELVRKVILPLVIAAVSGTMAFSVILPGLYRIFVGTMGRSGKIVYPAFLSWPSVLFQAGLAGIVGWGYMRWTNRQEEVNRRKRDTRCTAWSAVLGGALCPVVEQLLAPGRTSPVVAATFAPPAALGIVLIATFALVAFQGRAISAAEREWWAWFNALLLIAVLAWMGVLASIFYVPALVRLAMDFFQAQRLVLLGSVGSWLGATAAGVLAGKSARAKGDGTGSPPLKMIATLAPPVFLIGLLASISALVGAVASSGFALLTGVPVLAYISWKVARQVDVNLFSLHEMYANRLTRCFLGASRFEPRWVERWRERNPRVLSGASTGTLRQVHWQGQDISLARDPNPITGFDPDDDLALIDLRIGQQYPQAPEPPESPEPPTPTTRYLGPHLLLNTTLNLVGGQELAWRDRKSESFVLTPLYCGSKSTGYALLTENSREHMTLGRAVAISGAAVDPNMNCYQSAPMTALLTIFNARLGWWMQNPGYSGKRTLGWPKEWAAQSPYYNHLLWTELLGATSADREFVHLSDGGHFENLGVYELVRRRCRYIVVVDAGEDPNASDDNLANLIRRVRIDFGIRIELDTTPLHPDGPTKLSKTHVAVGEIHYEDVDGGERAGVIVYLKISMTGDEPPDLQQYAAAHPDFPHTSTFDQMFDEDLFESYRALGTHIAQEVFAESVGVVEQWRQELGGRYDRLSAQDACSQYHRRLFAALRGRWMMPPIGQDERYLESAKMWMRFERDLRRDPDLAALSRDIYPEFPLAQSRAELHAVGEMLQIMEEAWVNLRLKGHGDLPMNRGWMSVFRRWTATEAFRRLWPVHRSSFSPEFVRFCENQLLLNMAEPKAQPVLFPPDPLTSRMLDLLAEEFRLEWPSAPSLGSRITAARTLSNDPSWAGLQPRATARPRRRSKARQNDPTGTRPHPPIWLICQAARGTAEPADSTPERFACGIILVCPVERGDVIRLLPKNLNSKDGHLIKPSDWELLVWVRRAHRSTGLGSRCLLQVLPQIDSALARSAAPRNLWVRYPKTAARGLTQPERTAWLSFFSLFDFRPPDWLSDQEPGGELWLLRTPRAST